MSDTTSPATKSDPAEQVIAIAKRVREEINAAKDENGKNKPDALLPVDFEIVFTKAVESTFR